MFNKLNQLVKENAKKEVFLTAGIAESSLEAAVNEASGVMIDVLKSQLDNGKAKDLVSFFKGKKSDREALVRLMTNKYANRINKYYGISADDARGLSLLVIPSTMEKFTSMITEEKKEGNDIFPLLNWLSGNTVNFENFFLRMNQLQLA
ncbi:MAG: hypothetical protein ABIP95_01005 [Pelobium sp.]